MKTLSFKIDKHISWHNQIKQLIGKLNSRINLLKRANGYLDLHSRKLLFNALIKPVFEYCCLVWGNTRNNQMLRILRVQKCCSRLILDASFHDNSAQMFKKLQWMPIGDVIHMKKLCMMLKIVNAECPHYFTSYRTYVKNTHAYNIRASFHDHLAVPKCRSNTGLLTFHASATYLWNRLTTNLKLLQMKATFRNF